MADIVKKMDGAIPLNERMLTFNQTDAVAGDVILVQDSLGKPAKKVTIEAASAMTVKFNVYQMVFPNRKPGDGLAESINGGGLNLAQGVKVKIANATSFDIAANGELSIDSDIPVKDIEIVSAAGNFLIICS